VRCDTTTTTNNKTKKNNTAVKKVVVAILSSASNALLYLHASHRQDGTAIGARHIWWLEWKLK
jgi:hypothetical protein